MARGYQPDEVRQKLVDVPVIQRLTLSRDFFKTWN